MRIRWLTLAICTCAVLAALAVLFVLAHSGPVSRVDAAQNTGATIVPVTSTPSASADTVVDPSPTIVPPLVETITVYPSARLVSREKRYKTDLDSVTFITDWGPDPVAAFYSDYLTKAGWVLDWCKISDEKYAGQSTSEVYSYVWKDKTNVLPWKLSLVVSLSALGVEGQGVWAEIRLNRVPNFAAIPLYADAQQHTANWHPSTMWSGFDEEDISYVTSATPAQLTAYYDAILPEAGWSGPGVNDDIRARGLGFGWGKGGGEHITAIDLSIVATPLPSGETKVEIVLDGSLYQNKLP